MFCRLASLWCLLQIGVSLVAAEERLFYVGTYTGGQQGSEGIYLAALDTTTGELTLRGLAVATENPSFLAVHPNGKTVYAVNETNTGELSAFAVGPDHRLKELNRVPSGGGAPCHIVLDARGQSLLVANYSGGSVASRRLDDEGKLGEQVSFVQHVGSSVNAARQKAPHAHSINLDAQNQFAVAADLGTDELIVYAFDASQGSLQRHGATKLAPGAGPRHFAFHPRSPYAYAINELASTITALAYDDGKLEVLQTVSTLPEGFQGKSFTAEVRVSADGRFVYGSNRGHDSIAVFRVGPQGKLSRVQVESIGGKTPRNFNFDPSGRFLLAAGQSTGDIHVFRIDDQSGTLKRVGEPLKVPSPVCIRFAR